MKKFLLSLAIMAFAASASMAQTANVSAPQVKKECCKDHKDGQKCDKPADQQCPDCKEKAAKQCDKAAMKHECKEGKQCEKAAGMIFISICLVFPSLIFLSFFTSCFSLLCDLFCKSLVAKLLLRY